MPRNTSINLTQEWVELTDADVTSITIQNQGGYYAEVVATTGAAPSSSDGALAVPVFSAILNETLADLWPGVAGGVRVWARGNGRVMVSHA